MVQNTHMSLVSYLFESAQLSEGACFNYPKKGLSCRVHFKMSILVTTSYMVHGAVKLTRIDEGPFDRAIGLAPRGAD